MTVLNETTHAGEFLAGELPDMLSRKSAVLASGAALLAGTVLATVGGKYVPLDPSAATGAENATGILFVPVGAAADDRRGVVVYKDAAIIESSLVWPAGTTALEKAEALAALDALGIVNRQPAANAESET